MNAPNETLEPPKTLRPRPKLGLGNAWIGQEEELLVSQVLRTKRPFRYTYDLAPEEQGTMTATLERETREKMQVGYALAVTSGTAALETALAALGIGPGDEVIVPAWSWVSCFTSVVRMGALPVLAEIDETFCLAKGEITRLVTPRTKAVMVLHYQGVAADMDDLMAEARAAGIRVIEDCAQSIGATYRGRHAGTIGDIGIYSYQFQKSITSGEGGMVVTQDARLYERAVRFHDLGFLRPHHALFVTPECGDFCGAQYRMNELTGAVALAQFRKLDKMRAHCRALSRRILSGINDLPGLEFRRIPDPDGDSGFEIYFCLESADLAQEFSRQLHARNVNCSKMTGTYCQYERGYCKNRATYHPASSPFAKFTEWPAPGYRAEDFPKTEALVHRFVSLPLGVLYTGDDADYIVETVREVHREVFCGERTHRS